MTAPHARVADDGHANRPVRAGERRAFVRSASVLGSWTLVSRVLGYVRDSLNAALFGAGAVADAYFVAFRIPNLLRDLVGEGAFSAAVVPTVVSTLQKGGPREVHRLLAALLTVVALGGAVVAAVGVLIAPWLVSLLAPGFAASPAKFALTVTLTRWLFPFIAFMSLAASVMGYLNARERFGPGAFAPVALNLCIIAGGVLLCPLFGTGPETRIYGWTLGVLLGGLAQWLVQLPAARSLGFRYEWRLWHPGLRAIGVLMVPALVGFSVSQIYLLVNTILASLLAEGSVAYLYYGNRLMQLPLGVMGVALSTAAYPVVARALAKGRPGDAAVPLNHALALTAFSVLPASAGLIALSPWINRLLFRYGRFGAEDAAVTAAVASAYAIGIVGHACGRVLTPPFYAAGRPSVPVAVAVAGVTCNILLSVVLMFPLGAAGLPLSTSVVAIVTAVWLGWRLRGIVPGLGGLRLAGAFAGSLAASAAMGLAVWAGARWGDQALAAAGWGMRARDAAVTVGGIAMGLSVYAAFTWTLGLREFEDARDGLAHLTTRARRTTRP
ncbi:MAG: murein biosynthesis integral membrane protein MurJ [Candidatus Coatesbacteria bacterium]